MIYIKNSEDYPNMQYNPNLDCIDAWLIYGGCSTVFLKIHGDRLRELAEVESYNDSVTVYKGDRRGKRKVIKKMKIDKGEMNRYKSYNPLIAY